MSEPAECVSVKHIPGRIPSLDGLRAVSIALVVLAHTAGTRNAPEFLRHFDHLGNLGVKVFFEISGFLITTLLLRELAGSGRIDLKGFYLRRTLRIFPAFYLYVFVIAVLFISGIIRLRSGDLVHAVTYTMNYHVDRSWYLNHLWSLSVEEQFYLIWPPLIYVVGARRSIVASLVVVLLAPLVRMVMWSGLGMEPTTLTRQFQAVADSLAIGCLLAGCHYWLGSRKWYMVFLRSQLFLPLIFAGLGSLLVLFRIDAGLYYVFGQSFVNIAIVLCIDRYVRFPDGWIGRLLNSRPFVFVGVLSYSLYLWQELFLNPFDGTSMYTAFPINIGLAAAAALGSYYLIEKPFLRLKSRVGPRSTDRGPDCKRSTDCFCKTGYISQGAG